MFHLFAGETYYPSGGIGDLVGSYDTLEEAREAIGGTRCDWWHITDGDLREIESG